MGFINKQHVYNTKTNFSDNLTSPNTCALRGLKKRTLELEQVTTTQCSTCQFLLGTNSNSSYTLACFFYSVSLCWSYWLSIKPTYYAMLLITFPTASRTMLLFSSIFFFLVSSSFGASSAHTTICGALSIWLHFLL